MLYLKFRKSHFTFKETDELLLEICKNMINDETSKPNKIYSNKTYRMNRIPPYMLKGSESRGNPVNKTKVSY